MSEGSDDDWLQPVTINEVMGSHSTPSKRQHSRRCLRDANSLKATARAKQPPDYVCCAECGKAVDRRKINRHWASAHQALLSQDPSRLKVLSKVPPPQPLADWGFILLKKVGWAVFRSKYAREKKLFEAQTGMLVLRGHAGFDYETPKARGNRPPPPKKRKRVLSQRKGRMQGTPCPKK